MEWTMRRKDMERRGGLVGGLVLILIGVLWLAAQYTDVLGGWVVLVGLGVIFLLAYVANRQYGFLIPGCLLVGIGIPVYLIEKVPAFGDEAHAGVAPLGLGLGFIAIWLIDLVMNRERRHGWWPLIPGVIVSTAGIAQLAQAEAWFQEIGRWWPVLLILLGLWILVARYVQRQT